ncbi:MAG TPA: hypothetical protein DCG19_00395 [Cryomorphaceae bacterium]|nr:hypothetical protein [Cryomorphaceae bacterium]
MKRIWNILIGFILTINAFGQVDDLMIVEYVDWDPGNGLAIKIYNPTSSVINLSGYAVGVYNNGNLSPGNSVNLSGSLAAGDVLVVGNAGYPCSKDVIIGGGVNGNDVVALLKGGVYVDMISKVGVGYGDNNGLFYHNRLIRKNSNCIRYTSTDGTSPNSWPGGMIFSHPGWNATAVQCFAAGSPYTPNRDTVKNFAQICQGDSILLNGIYQSTAGVYYDSYISSSYCDSVVETQLFITPYPVSMQNQSICQGDSMFLGGEWRSQSGLYSDTLTGFNGCDSIAQTFLNVLPRTLFSDTVHICQGDSVLIGQQWTGQAGVYRDTLQAQNGCDSILSTWVMVLPAFAYTTSLTICEGESTFLQGALRYDTGIYHDTLTSIGGCDSIITTSLDVLPLTGKRDTALICEGDSLYIGGSWQTTPGAYTDTLVAFNGCDSILTTELMHPAILSGVANVQICQGDSAFIAGAWQVFPGLYTDTLPGSLGCDSLFYTQLDVVTNFQGHRIINLCAGDSATINGTYYKTDTSFSYTRSNPGSCDSVITVVVTRYAADAAFDWKVSPSNEQQIAFKNQSLQEGAVQWVFGDGHYSDQDHPVHTYAEPGLYTVSLTLITVNGCQDSALGQVAIASPEPEMEPFIPNSFTPNGDGLNDQFYISVQGVQVFSIEIYNRWGQKVFYSHDSQFKWSGDFAGQECIEGVYTYRISGDIQKTGVIHLIK